MRSSVHCVKVEPHYFYYTFVTHVNLMLLFIQELIERTRVRLWFYSISEFALISVFAGFSHYQVVRSYRCVY